MPFPDSIQDEVRHILPGEVGAAGGGEGEPEASTERYFSVRWMLERERAREESDDCSSAFAIIPVVGVCLMVLYVICLDQASQGLVVWLGGKSPLAAFMPSNLLGEVVVAGGDEMAIPGAYA